MFVKAQVGCPFGICLGTLSRNWSKMSKLMFDKSGSKEGESSRGPGHAGKGLGQMSPFPVCVSGTPGWSC